MDAVTETSTNHRRCEGAIQDRWHYRLATYDTVPLDMDRPCLSSIGRRFLEVLGKTRPVDAVIAALEIHEVITTQTVDIRRAVSNGRCAMSLMARGTLRWGCGGG
ncbi:MAG: hypothetical protein IPJ12_20325 [Betaproteobacteria bacterium]|nr:hypothetical protein [Betaproteobacteria bacterium]